MFGCLGSVIKRNLVPLPSTREGGRETDRQTDRGGEGEKERKREMCCGHTWEFENIGDGKYRLRGLRCLRNLRRGIFVLLLRGRYYSATIRNEIVGTQQMNTGTQNSRR